MSTSVGNKLNAQIYEQASDWFVEFRTGDVDVEAGRSSNASVALGLTIWIYLERNTYTTGVGEQRTITLDDGSNIELNATTQIRARHRSRRRPASASY